MTISNPETLKDEGLRLFRRGDYEQALSKFETAAQVYAQNEDEAGRAEILNNIGVIHRLRHNRTEALTALEEAEAAFSRLGDRNRQGQALGNLGDLHAANRNREEAARCYSDAAALFAQSNDGAKQSQVLRALSLLRLRQGRWLEAMMRMEESLQVRPHIGLTQRLFRGLLRFALRMLTGS